MIDVVVMAHPKRADAATSLAERTGARIVWDVAGDEWDTGARAWSAISPGADRGLVLQDDALPIDGFAEHLEAVAEHAPRTAVSLYVGTGRPRAATVTNAVRRAQRHSATWLRSALLLWGVAILLPAEQIAGMLAWATGSSLIYDQRISTYYRTRLALPVHYCWPSLVDHADVEGLLHHDRPPAERHAHHLGPPRRWDGPTITF